MPERWKPSVTVAAIIEHEGRFLLVEEQTPEGLKLNNPAGHLDPGESPQEGAVRETLEETARVFTPDRLVGIYMARFQRRRPSPPAPLPGREGSTSQVVLEDVTYLRFAFGGSASEADPARKLDHGIVRTLWMTLDELRASRARHRSALVLQCVEDYTAGKAYPLDMVFCDGTVYTPEIKS
jgi:8-oxo-dGTP pyrophosphatase MutT (NUDIX family)